MRNKIIKTIVYMFLLLILLSCNSNKISFDVITQRIESCGSKSIKSILINNVNTSENYKIIWEGKNSETPFYIDINHLQVEYIVKKGWQSIPIIKDDFKLSPLSKYLITREGGDAGAFEIIVETDNFGKIIKSSNSTCK